LRRGREVVLRAGGEGVSASPDRSGVGPSQAPQEGNAPGFWRGRHPCPATAGGVARPTSSTRTSPPWITGLNGRSSSRERGSASATCVREPEGETVIALPLENNAVISDCGKYRYVLTRQTGAEVRSATFVMLNPSTADATLDDPTIRKCIGFAKNWRCGRLVVLNLFAFRATDPEVMKAEADAVGPENKSWF